MATSFYLPPMTELDAVNAMLHSVGKRKVNSLTNAPPAASSAQTVLQRMTRSVQQRRWWFNVDFGYTLNPDQNGYITIPEGVLAIRPSKRLFIVERVDPSDSVRKLYDGANQTFVFTQGVQFDITWGFTFESIPQAARDYVTAISGREYQRGAVGSQILYKFDEELVSEALTALNVEHNRQKRANPLYANNRNNNIWMRPELYQFPVDPSTGQLR